jgi:hypothetical protein
MHEHIFTLSADVQQNYPQEWGSEEARIADAAGKLWALAAQGIATIVDPTVVGLGRYIPRIQRVAEQVPELNIIVATGLYTYDSVPFFFRHRGPALNQALGTEVPDPMVDMFVADIVEGDRGHRREGGDAQVRHRRGRHDTGGRAGHAGRRRRPPPDRRAGHGAHPSRVQDRAGGQAGAVRLRGSGARPGAARP